RNPRLVALRDKRIDDLYLFDSKAGVLESVNVESGRSTQVAEGVLRFEPHGKDVLAMVVRSPQNPKKVQYVIKDKEDVFVVREIDKVSGGDVVIAQYDSEWYFAAYDPREDKTYI